MAGRERERERTRALLYEEPSFIIKADGKTKTPPLLLDVERFLGGLIGAIAPHSRLYNYLHLFYFFHCCEQELMKTRFILDTTLP